MKTVSQEFTVHESESSKSMVLERIRFELHTQIHKQYKNVVLENSIVTTLEIHDRFRVKECTIAFTGDKRLGYLFKELMGWTGVD